MTTSNLERRLVVVLRQHAEDAMNRTDTGAKFETLIVGAEQDLRRRRRALAAGLISAAAAAALIAVVLGFGINRQDSIEPAQTPTPAEKVAADFLDAYAASDNQLMASLLAESADLNLWGTAERRWRDAVGYRRLNKSCQQQATIPAGIRVVCTFDYHMLGSDQLAEQPFSGSGDRLTAFTGDRLIATVRDDQIVAAKEVNTVMTNGFASEMWAPFHAWVTEVYPKDAADMYKNWPHEDRPALTHRSLALWNEHTQDFVNYVNEHQ